MDFANSRYCKISRCLLTFLGQWPRQNIFDRLIRTVMVVMMLTTVVLTQILKLCKSTQDLDLVIETIPPVITGLLSCTKLCTFVIHSKKLKVLQDEINEDWRSMKITEEIKIMETYTSEGELYATAYMLYMYLGGAPFFLLIFEPRVLDYFHPLNVSRPLKTVYPADYYFFNEEEHFYLITCHMSLSGVLALTILVASDTMIIAYTQYVCGMFAVTGHRLEYTLYSCNDTKAVSVEERKQKYHRYVVDCIHTHRKALKFINMLETTYSLSYLVQLGLSVVCMSVTLVQIVILLGRLEVVRYVLYAVGQLFRLFCTSYQGQKLIDLSTKTSNKIYGGTWYKAPLGTQKILLFMITKTAIPCHLSAGKMFIFSMESFSMVIQSCMSYCMVLASFR